MEGVEVYVVLGGGAPRPIALHSTRERAQTFVDERGLEGVSVEARPIQGDYEYPDEVHVACAPGPGGAELELAGLFADRDEAVRAAGAEGQVLALKPDIKRVDEEIH